MKDDDREDLEEREDQDERDESWFDRLDALIAGEAPLSSTDDDELLQMASHLKEIFAPLHTLREGDDGALPEIFAEPEEFEDDLAGRFILPEIPQVRQTSNFPRRVFALVAAGLFLVLNLRMFYAPIMTQVAHQEQQFVSMLPFQKNESPPLHADEDTPTLSGGFMAKYGGSHLLWYNSHIIMYGHNVFLYTEPNLNSLNLSSTNMKLIKLGKLDALVDYNSDGESVVIWHKQGVEFRLISKLPMRDLVTLARILQAPVPAIPANRAA